MRIDMDTYLRLGTVRGEFDQWLRDVGLVPDESITAITFGEGVHHLEGYEIDKDAPDYPHTHRIATQRAPEEDGVWRTLPVPREWDWAGPLPPAAVCARIRELEKE